MAKYEIYDNRTGRTYEIEGDRAPTDTEVESLISTMPTPEQTARDKAISGYSPMTRESAKMAEDRPNLWKSVAEEAIYDPMQNPNLKLPGKIRQMIVKHPALALKLLGAGFQSIEGGATAPIVAMQRGQFNPMDIAKTTVRSITGEAPTEIGDIARNVGAPEPVAQLAGLAGSAFLPGMGMGKFVKGAKGLGMVGGKVSREAVGLGFNWGTTNAAKATSAIRRGATKLVGKGADETAKAAARTNLALLIRGSPDWGRYAVKHRFDFIKPWQSVEEIEEQLYKNTSRVRNLIEDQFIKLGDDVGAVKGKYANTKITFETPSSITRDLTLDLYHSGGIKGVSSEGRYVFNEEADKLIGNVIAEINATLAENSGKVPLRTINGWKAKLSAIYKDTNHGGVRKTIDKINAVLKEQAPEDWNKANANYSALKMLREGKGLEGDLSLDKLLTTSISGKTPVERATLLNKNSPAVKALQSFEDTLPMVGGKKQKFLKDLQDAIANNEAKEWMPTKTTSIMGVAALGGASFMNPSVLPVFAGAAGASSPRGTALLYQRLLSRKSSPAAKAIRHGIMSGLVDPSIVRASREMAVGSQGAGYNPQQ